MCRGTSRHVGITEAISKVLRHDYRSPCISFWQRVMPSREIDVWISQGGCPFEQEEISVGDRFIFLLFPFLTLQFLLVFEKINR